MKIKTDLFNIKLGRRSERAQSMVELALSFTLLLMFLAGVIDLGRAFFAYMTIRDAAQEGALYGSTDPTDVDEIRARVRGTSSNFTVNLANLADGDIVVTATGNPLEGNQICNGGAIQVQITYNDFPLIFPFSNVLFGTNSIDLRTEIIDTILMPPCD